MRASILLFFVFLSAICFSQRKAEHAFVQGSVMGYHYEPKGFFKKEQVEIQGGIANVTVKAFDANGKQIKKLTTDKAGNFNLYLPTKSTYKLVLSKSGYGTSAVEINLKDVDDQMNESGLLLSDLEFILNDNETGSAIDEGVVFAKIRYNSSTHNFDFDQITFDKKKRLFKDPETSTPVNLLRSSVKRNDGTNEYQLVETAITEEKTTNKSKSKTTTVSDVEDVNGDSKKKSVTILSPSKFGKVTDWKDLSTEDIESRALELEDAWAELEKDRLIAVTEEDFMLIQAREEILLAAERELDAAKAYIAEQDSKLSAQRYFIIAMVVLLILILAFVFYLIKSIKAKNKLNHELDKRNKKIQSSINYAERIQQSVLLNDEQIHALLPDSFVLYKPLDVVSGDFYWFTELNNKVIAAAVDCTGHGVPGAFMSLIGNTLMNQIIKEKKVEQPNEILNHLHQGIVDALNQSDDIHASQDGMDMSICSFDKNTRELCFAGAVNPLYIIENGEFKEVSANIRGIGGVMRRRKVEKVNFEQERITLSKGSCFYMFSDGFMDQFGGNDRQKFNLPRFKALLLSITNEPMVKQKELMEKAFNEWKGTENQIDDVLVIGIKA